MKMRTLGRTGLDVSVLGFGAAPAAYLETDRKRAAQLIGELLDAGVNLIDTAASYPGSEEFLGEHFSGRRGQLVLVSKCGNTNDLGAPMWSQAYVTASVERSLRRLRTDRLDVMLLHSCGLDVLKKGEALAALVKAREAGKIRFAGYSGDNDAALFAAGLPDVAVIETSINLVDQVNLQRVLPLADQNDVGIIAKRPLANAAWKDLAQQPGMYQSYAQEYTQRLRQLQLHPRDLGFTASPEYAWPEIALRFVLSFPRVHTAIIGTTSPHSARQNLANLEKGPLAPEVVERLRSAFRAADPNGHWQGQT